MLCVGSLPFPLDGQLDDECRFSEDQWNGALLLHIGHPNSFQVFFFRVFYLYAIKKDGIIVYVPKKFDLSSVSKLEKLFFLTPFYLFAALTCVKCGWQKT